MNIVIPLISVVVIGLGYMMLMLGAGVRCDSGFTVLGMLLMLVGIVMFVVGILIGTFFPDLIPFKEILLEPNITVAVNV